MKEYKIAVIGNFGTGRSTTVCQLVLNRFIEKYDPTIEDDYKKTMVVDNEECCLHILDTAYLGRKTALLDIFLRLGHGYILIYSITSRSSFDTLVELLEEIKENKETDEDIPLVVVGNKSDLEKERHVYREEGEELASILKCPFFETSAKENINVENVFCAIIREIRRIKGDLDIIKTDK